jgi:hypothetical protein
MVTVLPASRAAIAARKPAPPAPMINTSDEWRVIFGCPVGTAGDVVADVIAVTQFLFCQVDPGRSVRS